VTAKRLVLSLAAAALLAGSGAVVHVSYFNNNAAVAFYAGLATAAAALYLFLHSLGATRLAGVHPLARTILACALLLPLGDLFTPPRSRAGQTGQAGLLGPGGERRS
jgi:hypothetical protein